MPCILKMPNEMPDSQRCATKEFVPPLEPTADSPSVMFSRGRNSHDDPNKVSQLSDSMRTNIPSEVLLEFVPNQGPPDIIGLFFSPIFSERVKDKLEELEPGVHEYFPIKAKNFSSGEEYGTYYLTFINQRPDIIDHDRTLYGSGNVKGTGGEFGKGCSFIFSSLIPVKPRSTSGPPLINFKAPGYEGRHLWRGTAGTKWLHKKTVTVEGPKFGNLLHTESMSTRLFCSDEFGEWLIERKIRGTEPIKIIEKPVEWYYEQRDKGKIH